MDGTERESPKVGGEPTEGKIGIGLNEHLVLCFYSGLIKKQNERPRPSLS